MESLTREEAEKRILAMLEAEGELSTQQIEERNKKEGSQCPDGTVKTLSRMRYKGLVKGQFSPDKGGWVWMITDKA